MRDASRVNRSGKPFGHKRAIRGLGANVAINLGTWALVESLRFRGQADLNRRLISCRGLRDGGS